MAYIYLCRSKSNPNKVYIGQASGDTSNLERIKQHISAAYSEEPGNDGAAWLIREQGCYMVQGAIFDESEGYGLDQQIITAFLNTWDCQNASNYDIAEILHIIGAQINTSTRNRYNKLIGGHDSLKLVYKGPNDDPYKLALQKVFNIPLPRIEVTRGNPVTQGEKVVYPGQYGVLKEFTKQYINRELSNPSTLDKINKQIAELDCFKEIILEYVKQYLEALDSKTISFHETSKTTDGGKQLERDIIDIIQKTLGGANRVTSVISALSGYGITINKGMFDGELLSFYFKDQIKSNLVEKKRRTQRFSQLIQQYVNQHQLQKSSIESLLHQSIEFATHTLYKSDIHLKIAIPSNSFYYHNVGGSVRIKQPSGAKQLGDLYKNLLGEITDKQKSTIRDYSRERIYKIIERIEIKNYEELKSTKEHLISRLHHTSPLNKINFPAGEKGGKEILSAYGEYKKRSGKQVGKQSHNTPQEGTLYAVREDMVPYFLYRRNYVFRPRVYTGDMVTGLTSGKDTKTYY